MTETEFGRLAQDCIDNFNFERVHGVMVLTDWKWGWGDSTRVPTTQEMVNTARGLLTHAYRAADEGHGPGVVSCGGFEATVDFEDRSVSLRFVLEENEVCAD